MKQTRLVGYQARAYSWLAEVVLVRFAFNRVEAEYLRGEVSFICVQQRAKSNGFTRVVSSSIVCCCTVHTHVHMYILTSKNEAMVSCYYHLCTYVVYHCCRILYCTRTAFLSSVRMMPSRFHDVVNMCIFVNRIELFARLNLARMSGPDGKRGRTNWR